MSKAVAEVSEEQAKKSKSGDRNAAPILLLGIVAAVLAGYLLNADPLLATWSHNFPPTTLTKHPILDFVILSGKFLLLGAGLCSTAYGGLSMMSGKKVRFSSILKDMVLAFLTINP